MQSKAVINKKPGLQSPGFFMCNVLCREVSRDLKPRVVALIYRQLFQCLQIARAVGAGLREQAVGMLEIGAGLFAATAGFQQAQAELVSQFGHHGVLVVTGGHLVDQFGTIRVIKDQITPGAALACLGMFVDATGNIGIIFILTDTNTTMDGVFWNRRR